MRHKQQNNSVTQQRSTEHTCLVPQSLQLVSAACRAHRTVSGTCLHSPMGGYKLLSKPSRAKCVPHAALLEIQIQPLTGREFVNLMPVCDVVPCLQCECSTARVVQHDRLKRQHCQYLSSDRSSARLLTSRSDSRFMAPWCMSWAFATSLLKPAEAACCSNTTCTATHTACPGIMQRAAGTQRVGASAHNTATETTGDAPFPAWLC